MYKRSETSRNFTFLWTACASLSSAIPVHIHEFYLFFFFISCTGYAWIEHTEAVWECLLSQLTISITTTLTE